MRTFKQFINEIGDSKRPFPYTMTERSDGKGATMMFRTDKHLQYYVSLRKADETSLDAGFETRSQGLAVVNQGLEHAFRVMATVMQAMREYVLLLWTRDKIQITEITFSASKVSKTNMLADKKGDQRLKLYKVFIKKAFGNVEWKSISKGIAGDQMSFTIPKGLYK